jgi:bacteriocin biosynthesis cyclodehydratase domain-containing protein
MSTARSAHPRLALPFTVVADGELVHLIAGEDVRYSIRAGTNASSVAALLLRCDGVRSLEELLADFSQTDGAAVRPIIERLYGERVLVDGSVERLHLPNLHRLVVEGRGELANRLADPGTAETSVAQGAALLLLCQDTLDPHAVLEFNRRCLRAAAGPWMWATTGPASRGFVSPVFLPNAGPCLECLVRHFQRLSPVPQLYEALARHGEQGGAFAAVTFPAEGVTILEQIVRWKLGQLGDTPHPAVFQLHVLELDSLEVSTHRVFVDPTCPECGHARLV